MRMNLLLKFAKYKTMLTFIASKHTLKDSKSKWMCHLLYMAQGSSIWTIKGAVLNFIKKRIYPVQS